MVLLWSLVFLLELFKDQIMLDYMRAPANQRAKMPKQDLPVVAGLVPYLYYEHKRDHENDDENL